jgi:phosphoserine phosphatase RsbU/P
VQRQDGNGDPRGPREGHQEESLVTTSALRSPSILVVDDDTTAAKLLTGILKQAGFQTACASTVAGAVAGVRMLRPDMVLLDVGLPDGTGFDACRLLQAEPAAAQMPVLFISAHEDVANKVRGFEAGGVDYITKPVEGIEVLARVRTHLRLKRAYERLAELQAEQVARLAEAQQTAMPRPDELPSARFQVAIRQVLAAGGDFYDVIPAGDRITDYLVADASGHDLAASYWTAALKALAAEYASPVNTPTEVVEALNRALCRILPSGAYFTLIYARLNRRNGRLALVNAGHPPAIILPADGTEPMVVGQEGDVLGAFRDAAFGATELQLGGQDRLFLYSDGLVELGTTREEGIRRLAATCAARRHLALEAIVPAVLDAVTLDAPPRDDVVLMAVER